MSLHSCHDEGYSSDYHKDREGGRRERVVIQKTVDDRRYRLDNEES